MSCKFCKSFDFTSIAVKDNNIHRSGGSSRFTDAELKGYGFEMFSYCPLCGSRLYYYEVEEYNSVEHEEVKPVVVSDEIPLDKELIYKLRENTGVGIHMCRDAFIYAKEHNGGYNMMLAYVKAQGLAVWISGTFDDRVAHFLKYIERDGE